MNWVQKENVFYLAFLDQYLFIVQEVEDGWRWIAGKPDRLNEFTSNNQRYATADDAKTAVQYFIVDIILRAMTGESVKPNKPVLLGPIDFHEVMAAATWYDMSDDTAYVTWKDDAPQDLRQYRIELSHTGSGENEKFESTIRDGRGTETRVRASLNDALRDTYKFIANVISSQRELVERPLRKEQFSPLTKSINQWTPGESGTGG